MTRYFCDTCKVEILSNEVSGFSQVVPGRQMAITVSANHIGGSTVGHWCRGCLIDAVNAVDDRRPVAHQESLEEAPIARE